MRNRRVKKVIFWTLGILSVPVLLGCAYGFYLTHTTEPPPTYYLHSNLPYHEVDIPFTLRDGHIFLTMKVAGRKIDSVLDTGAFDITWDKTLALPGRITGRTLTLTDAANNKIRDAEQTVLGSVRFGNYEVRGLTTYAGNTYANPKSLFGRMMRQTPMVGNEVFCGSVLTIDYYSKKIIVRDRSYDPIKGKQAPNYMVLPFRRQAAYPKAFYGKPVVQGTINGFPAQIQIDTGWPDHVCLNESFGRRALPKRAKGVTRHTDEGGNVSFLYPVVPVSFRRATANPDLQKKSLPPSVNFTYRIVAQVYPNIQQKCDAIVGYKLLRFFRVTIDYPRQKILLEPYGDDKIRILPKGALLTIGNMGQRPKQFRFDTDMVIFHYADKTTTVSPL